MSTSVLTPFPLFYDADGVPLEEGYIYVGVAGLNPETNPQLVYWDSALTIVAAQPVRTLNGYPSNSGTPGMIYTGTTNFRHGENQGIGDRLQHAVEHLRQQSRHDVHPER
jgi:hypothetical protein